MNKEGNITFNLLQQTKKLKYLKQIISDYLTMFFVYFHQNKSGMSKKGVIDVWFISIQRKKII